MVWLDRLALVVAQGDQFGLMVAMSKVGDMLLQGEAVPLDTAIAVVIPPAIIMAWVEEGAEYDHTHPTPMLYSQETLMLLVE